MNRNHDLEMLINKDRLKHSESNYHHSSLSLKMTLSFINPQQHGWSPVPPSAATTTTSTTTRQQQRQQQIRTYPHQDLSRFQKTTINNLYTGKTTRLSAIKITMKMVGKSPHPKNDPVENLCQMYTKRCQTNGIEITTIWYKDNKSLLKSIEPDNNSNNNIIHICFDITHGKQYTSEQFMKQLYSWYEVSSSRIIMIIGDAYGLPNQLLPSPNPNSMNIQYVCLSTMTLTHQLAQLICMEQIYRSSEIKKNSKYHK